MAKQQPKKTAAPLPLHIDPVTRQPQTEEQVAAGDRASLAHLSKAPQQGQSTATVYDKDADAPLYKPDLKRLNKKIDDDEDLTKIVNSRYQGNRNALLGDLNHRRQELYKAHRYGNNGTGFDDNTQGWEEAKKIYRQKFGDDDPLLDYVDIEGIGQSPYVKRQAEIARYKQQQQGKTPTPTPPGVTPQQKAAQATSSITPNQPKATPKSYEKPWYEQLWESAASAASNVVEYLSEAPENLRKNINNTMAETFKSSKGEGSERLYARVKPSAEALERHELEQALDREEKLSGPDKVYYENLYGLEELQFIRARPQTGDLEVDASNTMGEHLETLFNTALGHAIRKSEFLPKDAAEMADFVRDIIHGDVLQDTYNPGLVEDGMAFLRALGDDPRTQRGKQYAEMVKKDPLVREAVSAYMAQRQNYLAFRGWNNRNQKHLYKPEELMPLKPSENAGKATTGLVGDALIGLRRGALDWISPVAGSDENIHIGDFGTIYNKYDRPISGKVLANPITAIEKLTTHAELRNALASNLSKETLAALHAIDEEIGTNEELSNADYAKRQEYVEQRFKEMTGTSAVETIVDGLSSTAGSIFLPGGSLKTAGTMVRGGAGLLGKAAKMQRASKLVSNVSKRAGDLTKAIEGTKHGKRYMNMVRSMFPHMEGAAETAATFAVSTALEMGVDMTEDEILQSIKNGAIFGIAGGVLGQASGNLAKRAATMRKAVRENPVPKGQGGGTRLEQMATKTEELRAQLLDQHLARAYSIGYMASQPFVNVAQTRISRAIEEGDLTALWEELGTSSQDWQDALIGIKFGRPVETSKNFMAGLREARSLKDILRIREKQERMRTHYEEARKVYEEPAASPSAEASEPVEANAPAGQQEMNFGQKVDMDGVDVMETITLSEWAKRNGVSYETARRRAKANQIEGIEANSNGKRTTYRVNVKHRVARSEADPMSSEAGTPAPETEAAPKPIIPKQEDNGARWRNAFPDRTEVSLAEYFSTLHQDAQNTPFAANIQLLTETVGDTPVRIVSREEAVQHMGENPPAMYTLKDGSAVHVVDGETAVNDQYLETILEEAGHALTAPWLKANPEKAAEIKNVFEEAVQDEKVMEALQADMMAAAEILGEDAASRTDYYLQNPDELMVAFMNGKLSGFEYALEQASKPGLGKKLVNKLRSLMGEEVLTVKQRHEALLREAGEWRKQQNVAEAVAGAPVMDPATVPDIPLTDGVEPGTVAPEMVVEQTDDDILFGPDLQSAMAENPDLAAQVEAAAQQLRNMGTYRKTMKKAGLTNFKQVDPEAFDNARRFTENASLLGMADEALYDYVSRKKATEDVNWEMYTPEERLRQAVKFTDQALEKITTTEELVNDFYKDQERVAQVAGDTLDESSARYTARETPSDLRAGMAFKNSGQARRWMSNILDKHGVDELERRFVERLDRQIAKRRSDANWDAEGVRDRMMDYLAEYVRSNANNRTYEGIVINTISHPGGFSIKSITRGAKVTEPSIVGWDQAKRLATKSFGNVLNNMGIGIATKAINTLMSADVVKVARERGGTFSEGTFSKEMQHALSAKNPELYAAFWDSGLFFIPKGFSGPVFIDISQFKEDLTGGTLSWERADDVRRMLKLVDTAAMWRALDADGAWGYGEKPPLAPYMSSIDIFGLLSDYRTGQTASQTAHELSAEMILKNVIKGRDTAYLLENIDAAKEHLQKILGKVDKAYRVAGKPIKPAHELFVDHTKNATEHPDIIRAAAAKFGTAAVDNLYNFIINPGGTGRFSSAKSSSKYASTIIGNDYRTYGRDMGPDGTPGTWRSDVVIKNFRRKGLDYPELTLPKDPAEAAAHKDVMAGLGIYYREDGTPYHKMLVLTDEVAEQLPPEVLQVLSRTLPKTAEGESAPTRDNAKDYKVSEYIDGGSIYINPDAKAYHAMLSGRMPNEVGAIKGSYVSGDRDNLELVKTAFHDSAIPDEYVLAQPEYAPLVAFFEDLRNKGISIVTFQSSLKGNGNWRYKTEQVDDKEYWDYDTQGRLVGRRLTQGPDVKYEKPDDALLAKHAQRVLEGESNMSVIEVPLVGSDGMRYISAANEYTKGRGPAMSVINVPYVMKGGPGEDIADAIRVAQRNITDEYVEKYAAVAKYRKMVEVGVKKAEKDSALQMSDTELRILGDVIKDSRRRLEEGGPSIDKIVDPAVRDEVLAAMDLAVDPDGQADIARMAAIDSVYPGVFSSKNVATADKRVPSILDHSVQRIGARAQRANGWGGTLVMAPTFYPKAHIARGLDMMKYLAGLDKDNLDENGVITPAAIEKLKERQELVEKLSQEYLDETGRLQPDARAVFVTADILESLNDQARRYNNQHSGTAYLEPVNIGSKCIVQLTPTDSVESAAPFYILGVVDGVNRIELPHEFVAGVNGRDFDNDGYGITVASPDYIKKDFLAEKLADKSFDPKENYEEYNAFYDLWNALERNKTWTNVSKKEYDEMTEFAKKEEAEGVSPFRLADGSRLPLRPLNRRPQAPNHYGLELDMAGANIGLTMDSMRTLMEAINNYRTVAEATGGNPNTATITTKLGDSDSSITLNLEFNPALMNTNMSFWRQMSVDSYNTINVDPDRLFLGSVVKSFKFGNTPGKQPLPISRARAEDLKYINVALRKFVNNNLGKLNTAKENIIGAGLAGDLVGKVEGQMPIDPQSLTQSAHAHNAIKAKAGQAEWYTKGETVSPHEAAAIQGEHLTKLRKITGITDDTKPSPELNQVMSVAREMNNSGEKATRLIHLFKDPVLKQAALESLLPDAILPDGDTPLADGLLLEDRDDGPYVVVGDPQSPDAAVRVADLYTPDGVLHSEVEAAMNNRGLPTSLVAPESLLSQIVEPKLFGKDLQNYPSTQAQPGDIFLVWSGDRNKETNLLSADAKAKAKERGVIVSEIVSQAAVRTVKGPDGKIIKESAGNADLVLKGLEKKLRENPGTRVILANVPRSDSPFKDEYAKLREQISALGRRMVVPPISRESFMGRMAGRMAVKEAKGDTYRAEVYAGKKLVEYASQLWADAGVSDMTQMTRLIGAAGEVGLRARTKNGLSLASELVNQMAELYRKKGTESPDKIISRWNEQLAKLEEEANARANAESAVRNAEVDLDFDADLPDLVSQLQEPGWIAGRDMNLGAFKRGRKLRELEAWGLNKLLNRHGGDIKEFTKALSNVFEAPLSKITPEMYEKSFDDVQKVIRDFYGEIPERDINNFLQAVSPDNYRMAFDQTAGMHDVARAGQTLAFFAMASYAGDAMLKRAKGLGANEEKMKNWFYRTVRNHLNPFQRQDVSSLIKAVSYHTTVVNPETMIDESFVIKNGEVFDVVNTPLIDDTDPELRINKFVSVDALPNLEYMRPHSQMSATKDAVYDAANKLHNIFGKVYGDKLNQPTSILQEIKRDITMESVERADVILPDYTALEEAFYPGLSRNAEQTGAHPLANVFAPSEMQVTTEYNTIDYATADVKFTYNGRETSIKFSPNMSADELARLDNVITDLATEKQLTLTASQALALKQIAHAMISSRIAADYFVSMAHKHNSWAKSRMQEWKGTEAEKENFGRWVSANTKQLLDLGDSLRNLSAQEQLEMMTDYKEGGLAATATNLLAVLDEYVQDVKNAGDEQSRNEAKQATNAFLKELTFTMNYPEPLTIRTARAILRSYEGAYFGKQAVNVREYLSKSFQAGEKYNSGLPTLDLAAARLMRKYSPESIQFSSGRHKEIIHSMANRAMMNINGAMRLAYDAEYSPSAESDMARWAVHSQLDIDGYVRSNKLAIERIRQQTMDEGVMTPEDAGTETMAPVVVATRNKDGDIVQVRGNLLGFVARETKSSISERAKQLIDEMAAETGEDPDVIAQRIVSGMIDGVGDPSNDGKRPFAVVLDADQKNLHVVDMTEGLHVTTGHKVGYLENKIDDVTRKRVLNTGLLPSLLQDVAKGSIRSHLDVNAEGQFSSGEESNKKLEKAVAQMVDTISTEAVNGAFKSFLRATADVASKTSQWTYGGKFNIVKGALGVAEMATGAAMVASTPVMPLVGLAGGAVLGHGFKLAANSGIALTVGNFIKEKGNKYSGVTRPWLTSDRMKSLKPTEEDTTDAVIASAFMARLGGDQDLYQDISASMNDYSRMSTWELNRVYDTMKQADALLEKLKDNPAAAHEVAQKVKWFKELGLRVAHIGDDRVVLDRMGNTLDSFEAMKMDMFDIALTNTQYSKLFALPFGVIKGINKFGTARFKSVVASENQSLTQAGRQWAGEYDQRNKNAGYTPQNASDIVRDRKRKSMFIAAMLDQSLGKFDERNPYLRSASGKLMNLFSQWSRNFFIDSSYGLARRRKFYTDLSDLMAQDQDFKEWADKNGIPVGHAEITNQLKAMTKLTVVGGAMAAMKKKYLFFAAAAIAASMNEEVGDAFMSVYQDIMKTEQGMFAQAAPFAVVGRVAGGDSMWGELLANTLTFFSGLMTDEKDTRASKRAYARQLADMPKSTAMAAGAGVGSATIWDMAGLLGMGMYEAYCTDSDYEGLTKSHGLRTLKSAGLSTPGINAGVMVGQTVEAAIPKQPEKKKKKRTGR